MTSVLIANPLQDKHCRISNVPSHASRRLSPSIHSSIDEPLVAIKHLTQIFRHDKNTKVPFDNLKSTVLGTRSTFVSIHYEGFWKHLFLTRATNSGNLLQEQDPSQRAIFESAALDFFGPTCARKNHVIRVTGWCIGDDFGSQRYPRLYSFRGDNL